MLTMGYFANKMQKMW